MSLIKALWIKPRSELIHQDLLGVLINLVISVRLNRPSFIFQPFQSSLSKRWNRA